MMIFLKLLLSGTIISGLIFIAATTSVRNESLCYQPPKYIKPMHYDIKLISYIQRNIFYGEYNISILNQTQHIYLSSVKLCIENIVLFTNLEKHHKNDKDTIYKPTYNITKDTIDIFFMNELSPGNYTLNIKYLGTADEGFRIFDVKKKYAWVGAPHLQIIDARPVFPCWHSRDLLLKTTFSISLGCQHCTTLSNMPLRKAGTDEYDVKWKHFHITPVMWTHHATMIVSNYLSHLDNTIITMWCRIDTVRHMEFASNVAKNITLLFKNTWKRSKNILYMTHVAIPNFHDKGTTVFGLVLYRETDIIYDKNVYPIAQKIEVVQLVGRKVTQEWFYDVMNNASGSDFWFNKGLATLLATYAVNEHLLYCV
ncbi:aminopeptidase M1-A-like [Nylanderia fulva]|uniref:aminopeptidase M1-A-like n=1 Tax=Nylanderia fulva TaxID=613905 RepID=UPI0010FAD652|nr:aminopeptidase M1-A-like [Nylanderia fulva]XP_029155195.1 aminopeptidase M1-A-like [Nylanderia fulva]